MGWFGTEDDGSRSRNLMDWPPSLVCGIEKALEDWRMCVPV